MNTTAYVARMHEGAAGAPILFAFHGTGGDENQFFGLAREMLPDATIIAPRGNVSERGAARFFRRTGEGVYDMQDLVARTEAMIGFVQAHATGDRPVYGFGYSNGANILASVMVRAPQLFQRVGLLHPLIPWTPEPVDLSGTQVLLTAGQRDPICPWPESERLIAWLGAQGARVTPEVHSGGHELRQTEVAALNAFLSSADAQTARPVD